MSHEQHPDWCDRASCSAFSELYKRYHRSSPTVIATQDADTWIYVHRGANPGGTGEYVEVTELDEPVREPWYENATLNGHGVELNMDLATADKVHTAIAALQAV